MKTCIRIILFRILWIFNHSSSATDDDHPSSLAPSVFEFGLPEPLGAQVGNRKFGDHTSDQSRSDVLHVTGNNYFRLLRNLP